MPKDLSDEQREAVAKLAEALNGQNPRASLLSDAGRSGAEGRVSTDG